MWENASSPAISARQSAAVPFRTAADSAIIQIAVLIHLYLLCLSLIHIYTAIFDKEYGGIDVHGEVTNTSDVAHEYLDIMIVFFDSEGHSIGQAYDLISETLQPGETRGFDISASDLPTTITTADIAKYQVYAFPEQYQY